MERTTYRTRDPETSLSSAFARKKDLTMEKAIKLLEVEIRRMQSLADVFHQQGLNARGNYREEEARRLKVVLDLLKKKT